MRGRNSVTHWRRRGDLGDTIGDDLICYSSCSLLWNLMALIHTALNLYLIGLLGEGISIYHYGFLVGCFPFLAFRLPFFFTNW